MTRLSLLLFVSLCLSPVARAQVTDGNWWCHTDSITTQHSTCPTLLNQLRQIFVAATSPWREITRSALGPIGPMLWAREEKARAPGSNGRR
jgi:hypothetical protein